jgi:hypothetical protein
MISTTIDRDTRIDDLEQALHQIVQYKAYPLEVFGT